MQTSTTRATRDDAPPQKTARFPFEGFPKGWFVVALSEDLPADRVVPLHYFGRDLIAYRGASGRAYVTDAYCPHLGAHLAHGGAIEGESVRCPFHGWRFEDGRCVEVPYSEILPRAAIPSFPVREQNGVIHVFHDPSGGAPWELPVLDEERWTEGRTIVWRNLRTHPQEVFENTVDMPHIGPVHNGRSAAIIGKPERDGVKMRVRLEFQAPGDVVGMPEQINDVMLDVAMLGLGHVVVSTHVRNVDIRARQRIYATPVDAETIDIRGVVHVERSEDAAFTEELAEIFYRAYVEDFAKDFPIWENKRYLEAPHLTKGDGPIGLYRRWCTQFYAEKANEGRDEEREVRGLGRVRAEVQRVLEPARDRLIGAWSLVRARGRSSESSEAPRSNGHAPSASVSSPSVSSAPSAPAVAAPRANGHRIASGEDYFASLEDRFVPAAAKGVDAVFQWDLGGQNVFHACVKDGRIELARGPHAAPTVVLAIDEDEYVRVINGDLDGTWAFTRGSGKVRGSITAAMKMRTLFPA